jgi:RNA-directed DNA polymerase
MTSRDVDRRVEIPDSHPEGSRRNRREEGLGASRVRARREDSGPETEQLLEAVVERENMWKALKQVERNRGAAGVDNMTVEQLRAYLREHWLGIKEELLAGDYQPMPVRKVEIPKPGSQGVRMLGIPTVIDRLIQQALHQVLSPLFEPSFSEASYGFRPQRSAQQAVLKAREYVRQGRRWVVDIDLEKFFDRVNHDVLMSRLARRIKDKRVLRLIRRYLQAGMMSNILLDELDKELERRGHKFCRYADDCNIYVRSRSAGERVMKSLTRFLERRLRLQVNAGKSAVARPWERKFLGYSLTWHREARLKVAASSVQRLKAKLREIFRRGRGRNVGRLIEAELTPLLRGWMNYFRLTEVKGIFDELDSWIRRKLRCVIWRQWKRPSARATGLLRRGLKEAQAWASATNGRGPWWNAGASHMNAAFPKSYFDRCGLLSLLEHRLRFQLAS